jgi:plastocyanin
VTELHEQRFQRKQPEPSTPSPTIAGVVTINVVAVNGAQLFSPNPATLPAGQMVVWHNVDT